MDIKEAKDLRSKLESDIGQLISDFSNKTQLKVDAIHVLQINEMAKDHPVGYLIDVTITIPRY
jgi:hypothetical protein